MKLPVTKQTLVRVLWISAVFVLIATTIYFSAASRVGARQPAEAIDLKDPAQVRQALLFSPFEPEQARRITGRPHVEVLAFTSGQTIVDKKGGFATAGKTRERRRSIAKAPSGGPAGASSETSGANGSRASHKSDAGSKSIKPGGFPRKWVWPIAFHDSRGVRSRPVRTPVVP